MQKSPKLLEKLIFVLLGLSLAGCGTFAVKVEVLPPAVTATQPPVALASPQPPPTQTLTQPEPTATLPAAATPTEGVPTAEPITLTALQMEDAQHGWGIESAGRVVKTTDGGGLWWDVTPLQGKFERHSLFALNPQTAWVAPAQLDLRKIVWRTQDGGQTWEPSQPLSLGSDKYSPLSLQFPDARHGWLLVLAEQENQNRQVLLFRSENGGVDWAPVELNQGALQSYLPPTMTNMAFFDGQTGWLGGWWGKDDPARWLTVTTSNGGAQWGTEPLQLPVQKGTQCDGHSIPEMAPGSLAVEMTCTIAKDPKYLFHRAFYLSTSGEPAWHSWVIPGDLLGVSFLNAKQGWMLVSTDQPQLNQVMSTQDGGGSWRQVSVVAWKQAQFDFVDAKTGWAIVGNGFATALVRTENGGQVWVQVRPALVKP